MKNLLYGILLAGAICLVFSARERSAVADPPATDLSGRLDAVLATYGVDLVEDRWAEGLETLLTLAEDVPAVAGARTEALKGIEAWKAGRLSDARISLDMALVALMNAPSGTNLDVLLGGALFRGSRNAWERRRKEASDKLFFAQPHNLEDYDTWVLGRGSELMKEGHQAQALAIYEKGIGFLWFVAKKDADFSEAFRNNRIVQTRLALARALEDGGAPPRAVFHHLQKVVKTVGDLQSAEAREGALEAGRELFDRERHRAAFAVRGHLIRARVARLASGLRRSAGDAQGHQKLLVRACALVSLGTALEEDAGVLAAQLARDYPRALETQLLAGQLHQGLFHVLAPQTHTVDPSSTEGRELIQDTRDALANAKTAFGHVVALDPERYDAQLYLAELLYLEHGTEGKVPAVVPAIATKIQAHVKQAIESGSRDAEVQHRGAMILLTAGLPGAKAPLEHFLELTPADPRVPEVQKLLESIEE